MNISNVELNETQAQLLKDMFHLAKDNSDWFDYDEDAYGVILELEGLLLSRKVAKS